MFGHQHDVPVLRMKPAELRTLRDLEPTLCLLTTPILECPPRVLRACDSQLCRRRQPPSSGRLKPSREANRRTVVVSPKWPHLLERRTRLVAGRGMSLTDARAQYPSRGIAAVRAAMWLREIGSRSMS